MSSQYHLYKNKVILLDFIMPFPDVIKNVPKYTA